MLRTILDGGLSLGLSQHVVFVATTNLLQNCVSGLSRASVCSIDHATDVARTLDQEAGVVRLFSQYPYIRVKSLALALSARQEVSMVATQGPESLPSDMTREVESLPSNTTQEESDASYCWCGRKEDGAIMVCCDNCDVWFHIACVSNPKNKVGEKKIRKGAFSCPACCERSGVPYPFAWPCALIVGDMGPHPSFSSARKKRPLVDCTVLSDVSPNNIHSVSSQFQISDGAYNAD